MDFYSIFSFEATPIFLSRESDKAGRTLQTDV